MKNKQNKFITSALILISCVYSDNRDRISKLISYFFIINVYTAEKVKCIHFYKINPIWKPVTSAAENAPL